MGSTTVRLSVPVKERLEEFKNFERESFEDVIERLLNIASDEPLSSAEIRQIEASLKDLKEGKVLSLKEAEKTWGI